MPRNNKPILIIITGGVLSGLGKGTTAASIGFLLKAISKRIVTIKCDGYLNYDPGTMNPYEHGEVFVLDDGGEVDMDFGHYERFIGIRCKSEWNLTGGKIFHSIIEKERKGIFLGKTIQIYPHISNEIKERIKEVIDKEKPRIVIIEIGGTVGDIESSWFIKAITELSQEYKTINIHLTYIPFLKNVKEFKTKPAQRDLSLVRSNGIEPDILIVRSQEKIPEEKIVKLSKRTNIPREQIINGVDLPNIYEIPLMFIKEGILKSFMNKGINIKEKNIPDIDKWKKIVKKKNKEVNILIVGKYTDLNDSYASVIEAIHHAAIKNNVYAKIEWIEATNIEKEGIKNKTISKIKRADGIIVPGGFGKRGIEGKIKLIEYARKKKIPFLGLCLGLQLAVIEYARNVVGIKNANSTEFSKKCVPLIDFLPEQRSIMKKGGTMRLGEYPAILKKGTIVQKLYGKEKIMERHRHRYEVNPRYVELLEKNGLVISGRSPNRLLVEFIELPKKVHPFFVATQSHPEFKSKPLEPAPLFYGFIKAVKEYSKRKK